MTENQYDIIERLRRSEKTPYYISKKTGLSNSTIANWLNGKTRPTPANVAILEHFFLSEKSKYDKSINAGVIKHSTITQDNRYYSDSPDILRAQIDVLDRMVKEKEERIKEKDAQIKEKDAQIKEKDAQIKEKDAQIKALLEIMAKK